MLRSITAEITARIRLTIRIRAITARTMDIRGIMWLLMDIRTSTAPITAAMALMDTRVITGSIRDTVMSPATDGADLKRVQFFQEAMP